MDRAPYDTPANIYYFPVNINANITLLESGYYAFLYFFISPFVYGIQFDAVMFVLLRQWQCV